MSSLVKEHATRKRFATHGGSQDVNATDDTADRAFIRSNALIPMNQNKFGRCKQARKPIQKCLEYEILLLEEKRRKMKSKMKCKLNEEDLLYTIKNQRTVEECMVQFDKDPHCVQLSSKSIFPAERARRWWRYMVRRY